MHDNNNDATRCLINLCWIDKYSMLREYCINVWGLEMGPLQGVRVCFKDSENILHEILDWRAKEGHAKKHSQFSPMQVKSVWRWLNRQCCLALPSLALQSRISCKIFLDSLKLTRSPCIGPVSGPKSFI